MLEKGRQEGEMHRTVFSVGNWILTHPKDKICLAATTPQDAENILKRVRELFGVSTKNVTIA